MKKADIYDDEKYTQCVELCFLGDEMGKLASMIDISCCGVVLPFAVKNIKWEICVQSNGHQIGHSQSRGTKFRGHP